MAKTSTEPVLPRIHTIRRLKVVLDSDLRRLAEIDKKLIEHDVVLGEVVKRLQPLLNPPREKPKPKIGFHRGNR